MRCDEAKELMLDVTDRKAMPPALAEHVASCPACREHLDMLARHSELFAAVSSPETPEELWGRIEKEINTRKTIPLRPILWSAAAAAVVLIMVGLSFIMQPPSTGVTGTGTHNVATRLMEMQSVDSLLAQHATLQNANILNAALVSETEQTGYLMLAGGTH